MTGREAVLKAFDQLFEKAAAKLQIVCSDDEKLEAKRDFIERSEPLLAAMGDIYMPPIPDEVMATMQAAIDRLSPSQLVGYLAAIPLLRQTQEIARRIAYREAEQKMLEHLISQADDRYGGN